MIVLPLWILLYLFVGLVVSIIWAAAYDRDMPFGVWTLPVSVLFPLVILISVGKSLLWAWKNCFGFNKSGIIMIFVAMKRGSDGLDQYERELHYSSE